MKELKVILNTGMEGISTFETEKISGVLKYVVLINEKILDIRIDSEIGYTLYNQFQHVGTSNFILVPQPRDSEGHKHNFINGDHHLNEKLKITIQGAKNSDMTIILRYVE